MPQAGKGVKSCCCRIFVNVLGRLLRCFYRMVSRPAAAWHDYLTKKEGRTGWLDGFAHVQVNGGEADKTGSGGFVYVPK